MRRDCSVSIINVVTTPTMMVVRHRPVAHRRLMPSGTKRMTLRMKSTPPSGPQNTQKVGVTTIACVGRSVMKAINAKEMATRPNAGARRG